MKKQPFSDNEITYEKVIDFLLAEYSRQNPELYQEYLKRSEFNWNPAPTLRDNFTWLGNTASLKSYYTGAVLRNEILFADDEEVFCSHYGKNEPRGTITINKRRLSHAIYLHKRFAEPQVKLLRPEYWHRIMPLHFVDEFGMPVKWNSVNSRASLELEACVKSHSEREMLDAIVEDALWANRNP